MMWTRVPSRTTNAFEILRGRTRGGGQLRSGTAVEGFSAEALSGALEGCFEALRADRLQQIVHGVDFEGADGVLS